MHLVLLDVPTRQVVHIAGTVDLHGEVGGIERPLFPNKDVEVVVGGVHAAVAFRANRGAEDDEIFSDASVDDVHGTHSTTRVVKHPFGGVGIQGNDRRRVLRSEVGDDVGNDSIDVVWMRLDRVLGECMKGLGGEDVPAVLQRICRSVF